MADELARQAAENCFDWYWKFDPSSDRATDIEQFERIISEAYAPLREELAQAIKKLPHEGRELYASGVVKRPCNPDCLRCKLAERRASEAEMFYELLLRDVLQALHLGKSEAPWTDIATRIRSLQDGNARTIHAESQISTLQAGCQELLGAVRVIKTVYMSDLSFTQLDAIVTAAEKVQKIMAQPAQESIPSAPCNRPWSGEQK